MNDIATAKVELIAKLTALKAPSMSPLATPDEITALGEHLAEFAKMADAYVLTLGAELKGSCTTPVELGLFTNVLTDALEGNGTYEIEWCGDEARQRPIRRAA